MQMVFLDVPGTAADIAIAVRRKYGGQTWQGMWKCMRKGAKRVSGSSWLPTLSNLEVKEAQIQDPYLGTILKAKGAEY